MKKETILLFLFGATFTFLASCNSNPSAKQYLQDENHRKDVIATMVHHQPYMTEIMHEMMSNDSCKQMMMSNMMNDEGMKAMQMDKMMSMCKDDSSMCKMMMGKTMEMCDADPAKCKMMMGSMQSHPNVMKSMKGIEDMDNMGMTKDENYMKTERTSKEIVYTCPMHSLVRSDKAGKCPKCGMALVEKN